MQTIQSVNEMQSHAIGLRSSGPRDGQAGTDRLHCVSVGDEDVRPLAQLPLEPTGGRREADGDEPHPGQLRTVQGCGESAGG